MSLPFFYTGIADVSGHTLELDEENSAHAVQVLRMRPGERLQLTDGKGLLATARIEEAHKKHCRVFVEERYYVPSPGRRIVMGVSLLKNSARFEWFLEKATELGIAEIIPLQCERTIREKFRFDRMKGICVSAMLQSQQAWLPVLHEPIGFGLLFRQEEIASIPHRFIAHCEPGEKQPVNEVRAAHPAIMLIGPEGDFTPAEIEMATGQSFVPVSLGTTRLRTETAALAAAVQLAWG